MSCHHTTSRAKNEDVQKLASNAILNVKKHCYTLYMMWFNEIRRRNRKLRTSFEKSNLYWGMMQLEDEPPDIYHYVEKGDFVIRRSIIYWTGLASDLIFELTLTQRVLWQIVLHTALQSNSSQISFMKPENSIKD